MIGTLRGVLTVRRPDEVVVEAGGVGYLLSVGVNTFSALPEQGREVFFYIYTHVREDALQLFGFATEEEKRIFVTLLGISGIGPRVALSVVSAIPHDKFLIAVEAEDIELLTRVPGLGKKTAHRIVLELRGKLPRAEAPLDRATEDALSALQNLGYKKADAMGALQKAAKNGYNELEPLVKEALRVLTGGDDGKS